MDGVRFTWERPVDGDGFELTDRPALAPDDAYGGPWLARREGAVFREYRPLAEYSGLFQSFAEVDPRPANILAFANGYGWLLPRDSGWHLPGLQAEGRFYTSWMESPDVGPRVVVEAESVGDWVEEIEDMRHALELWGRIGEGDPHHPAAAEHWEKLGRLITGHLHAVQPALGLRAGKSRLSLDVTPGGLGAALWLQLALAVSGNKGYRRCTVCGRPFELGREGSRRSRLTCGAGCRNRGYRERQDRARQLHAGGKTFKQIAKELGSDVKTVKGWVTGHKE